MTRMKEFCVAQHLMPVLVVMIKFDAWFYYGNVGLRSIPSTIGRADMTSNFNDFAINLVKDYIRLKPEFDGITSGVSLNASLDQIRRL